MYTLAREIPLLRNSSFIWRQYKTSHPPAEYSLRLRKLPLEGSKHKITSTATPGLVLGKHLGKSKFSQVWEGGVYGFQAISGEETWLRVNSKGKAELPDVKDSGDGPAETRLRLFSLTSPIT